MSMLMLDTLVKSFKEGTVIWAVGCKPCSTTVSATGVIPWTMQEFSRSNYKPCPEKKETKKKGHK